MRPPKTPSETEKAKGILPEPRIQLRLLNFTDLHMEIRGYDYFNDAPGTRASLLHAASLMEQLKGEVTNTLVFDNGDILQGNPMGDYAAEKIGKDPSYPHPMIAALNALKIDAATLGNHEFNYGLGVVQAVVSQSAFPIVSANVLTKRAQTPDGDTTLVPPYAMLTRSLIDTGGGAHELRIGVLGLLPPQIVHWDRKHLENRIWTRDIMETAAFYVPKLRAAGADLVVVLCHSGIEDVDAIPGLENAAVPVAALDGVDVVMAGHSHLVFPSADFATLKHSDTERGLIHGTPVTMAGFGGSHVGCVDLNLSLSGETWKPVEARARAIAVDLTRSGLSATAADILTVTEAAHRETLGYVRQPIGATACPLDTYLAMVSPSPAVQLVAAAQAWHMRDVLKDTSFAETPLLSAAAPFKMGGRGGPGNFTHVPVGEIALRHVADLYAFPNVLRAVLIDGLALRAWLEYSAGLFAQVREHQADQRLIDPTFPSFNFDTITGVTYDIDLTQAPRFERDGAQALGAPQRIRNLRWQGAHVTDTMAFVVVTNDYRVSGAGNYPGARDGKVIHASHDSQRDILVRYLRATPADRTLMAPPWRLMPVKGASVLFETSPNLQNDQNRLTAHAAAPLGVNNRGFLTCRKTF